VLRGVVILQDERDFIKFSKHLIQGHGMKYNGKKKRFSRQLFYIS